MYPFPQSVAPAVRTHVDAQTAFLNDMSKSMFRSFQQMCDLNIQLVQTMIEETTLAGKQVLSADRQTELLSAATSRAQPASDKLRAYQQHLTRLAADAQVELSRVTEQHIQNTTRTARALADEVARDATEQTERGLRAQQETVRQFADPFARTGDGAAYQPQSGGSGEAARSGEASRSGAPQAAGQQAGSQGQRSATTH
ncbi:granule-associated protein [Massilia sp. WF1]|uniref:phasin family protein n=1 Tax=unclassified Massilia TaxID=2609279 RepID=UPI00064B61E5|nr:MULTISPECIES: phasin family protein [unclassified Massilia]ALK98093.1 granule-associated protein [Massilia sp. WG5]KLU35566.1 granule-associated protein [Massilia sp. WF1]